MKRIVITGASEGIGKAIAHKLAAPDVTLLLVARNEEKLQAVAKEVEDLGGAAEIHSLDLKDWAALVEWADSIESVDILINNAGVWHKMSMLDEIGDDTIESVLSTNLSAPILLTKHLLPKLTKSTAPKIINIISKSGVTAQDGQSVYTASKWGMKGFTDVLRNDLKETNVRIGAVYQSGTATNMFDKTGETVPLEKFTDPNDLASVIKFMIERPDKIWLNEVHIAY